MWIRVLMVRVSRWGRGAPILRPVIFIGLVGKNLRVRRKEIIHIYPDELESEADQNECYKHPEYIVDYLMNFDVAFLRRIFLLAYKGSSIY